MMMLRKKTLLWVLGVVAIVTLLGAVPLFAGTDEVEIIGTVFGTEWDANDNATAVKRPSHFCLSEQRPQGRHNGPEREDLLPLHASIGKFAS
jgi:hypothetical protein